MGVGRFYSPYTQEIKILFREIPNVLGNRNITQKFKTFTLQVIDSIYREFRCVIPVMILQKNYHAS